MRGRCLLAVCALVLTGCTKPAPVPAPTATDALAGWRDFPVDRKPRPIVLVDDPGGFTPKVTAVPRLVLAATPEPAPATARVTLPDGPADLALQDASVALAALAPRERGDAVAVTGVTLDSASYATDRGQVTLPTWFFNTEQGIAHWPAVAPSAFWHLDAAHWSLLAGRPAYLAGDGRSALIAVAVPDSCGRNPVDVTAEGSATAVVVRVAGATGRCLGDDVLRFQQFDVAFDAPLGARVLLTGDGGVMAVVG